MVPVEAPVIDLDASGELQLWFATNNRCGCNVYDADVGKNYRFHVAPAAREPGWLGNAQFAQGRGGAVGPLPECPRVIRPSFFGFAASVLALVVLGPACGSSDREPAFPDPDVTSSGVGPDGAPYPEDDIGALPRVNGRRGQRIPNLSFQGYVNGDRAAGLKTISLADYYDPKATRHKVLILLAAATWCSICAATSEALVPRKAALEAEGAVFLEVVINGNTLNEGPSLGEVEGWMSRHQTNYSTAIDVRARRLGGLGVNTVPWSWIIDTRSMEMLEGGAGAPADMVKYARAGITFVNENPPSY